MGRQCAILYSAVPYVHLCSFHPVRSVYIIFCVRIWGYFELLLRIMKLFPNHKNKCWGNFRHFLFQLYFYLRDPDIRRCVVFSHFVLYSTETRILQGDSYFSHPTWTFHPETFATERAYVVKKLKHKNPKPPRSESFTGYLRLGAWSHYIVYVWIRMPLYCIREATTLWLLYTVYTPHTEMWEKEIFGATPDPIKAAGLYIYIKKRNSQSVALCVTSGYFMNYA